jgi:hypothetical protein
MLPENKRPRDIDKPQEIEQPNNTTKFLNWLVGGALVVVAIGLAIILDWSFANENVLVVKNSPFPVRTIREHPEANGVVILNVDYCKNVDIKGRIRTSFVSETREVFLPLSDENIPKGCETREIPVLIPKDITPDTYKIKFRATYDINPLKRGIVSEFETQEFVVDPAK